MERRIAGISDLDRLSHLTTLQIKIPNVKTSSKFLFVENLVRYEILIGNDWYWDRGSEYEPKFLRKLKLCLDRSFQLEVGIKKILKSCDCLYLGEMEGVDCIPGEDFPKLKYLNINGNKIKRNSELQYIISWTGVQGVAFPLLESIYFEDLIKLEKICHGQLAEGSFGNLRRLEVCGCDSLRFMFSSSVVGNFSKLQEIDIRDCRRMSAIVAKEREEEIETNDITTNKMEFPQLHCLRIQNVPNLMGFHLGVDSHSFFNEKNHMIHTEQFCNLPNLKHGRSSDPQANRTFQNLCEVRIDGCIFLKSVFPISVAKSLTQLEELHIKNCGVEEIVAVEGGSETITEFVLPRVTCLELENLPELKCFYPRKHTSEWPSLRRLKIYRCPKVKIASLDDISCQDMNGLGHHHVPIQRPLSVIEKVGFPCLEIIDISNIDNLIEIWHNQFVSNSFHKLQKLNVKDCENLRNIFPPNIVRRLQNLEELEIFNCTSVEVGIETRRVIVEERTDLEASNSMLRDLKLYNLPKLEHVWSSSPFEGFFWKNLREVEIDRCKSLKSLFPVSVAKGLVLLERLHIKNCGVEEIVALDGESETAIEFEFQYVTFLILEDLPKLKCFYPSKHASKWESLKTLEINECPELNIFTLPDLSFQDTNGLGRHNVPIQPPQQVRSLFPEVIFTFENLHEVKVSNCASLRSLFPFSVAKQLLQLDMLEICDCQVREIVGKEEDLERRDTLIFPQLTSLRLERLPQLENFCGGEYISKWPSLKVLNICDCDKLKSFGSDELSFKQTSRLCHPIQEQTLPIFFVEKDTFPNLEGLKLSCKDTKNQMQSRFPAQFFSRLKFLELSGALFEELCFLINEEQQYAWTLERLTVLKLSNMPKLMYLWKENSQPSMAFQNLEKLEVSTCGTLKNLVPSSMSFQNLRKLEVSKCHGLISLLNPSTAKSLVRLTKMVIFECEGMTEIVANEGDEAGDEIIFSELKSLKLHSLHKLTSFHSGNCTIKFPSLHEVIRIDCAHFKTSSELSNIPKLKSFKRAGVERPGNHVPQMKELGDSDLITIIERFWEENFEQLPIEKAKAQTTAQSSTPPATKVEVIASAEEEELNDDFEEHVANRPSKGKEKVMDEAT